MHPWKFGTINIRTGNEKDEGHIMYSIAKKAAKQTCLSAVSKKYGIETVGAK